MKTKGISWFVLMFLFLAISVPAMAQYPTKAVTLVAWASPGSSSDIAARTVAKVSEKFLGQSIVVLNKEGGAGLVAMKYILSQPADGYTLLLNTKSLITTLSRKGVTIKPEEFEYIAGVQNDPNLLSVGPASPVKDLKSFLDYAKKNPNKFRVAGFETGGYHNCVILRMEKIAGIKLMWVPYGGSGEAAVATMGGHVDGTLSNPTPQLGGIESGKLIPIATTDEKRLEMFPNVPTLKEFGVDLAEFQYRGVIARKGIPKEIIPKLMNAFKQGTETDEWKGFIKKVQQPYFFMNGPEYEKLILSEFPVYKEIIEGMEKASK